MIFKKLGLILGKYIYTDLDIALQAAMSLQPCHRVRWWWIKSLYPAQTQKIMEKGRDNTIIKK